MITRSDLEAMTISQLDDLAQLIPEVRSGKLEAEKTKLMAQAEALGIKLHIKYKVAPKYRNPANNSETWSGRGHEPKWFKALNKRQRDDARINPDPK